jgi:DNA-binding transcriptional ArsR family regulator
MAARLVLVSALLLLAATVPAGAEPLPEAHGIAGAQASAGPVSVGSDTDTVRVDTGLPVALDVDRTVALPLLPDLSVGVHPDAAPDEDSSPASPSPQSSRIVHLPGPTPLLLLAGTSLLATFLVVAAWMAQQSLGLFSRIEDDALAAHPLRRQALDLIAASPGATVQDVRRGLGVAWGTAVYHLGRLERAGLVAVRHSGGRRGHWPLGQAPPRDALAPTGEALARLVRERPGLPQNELARLAGIGPPAACKQLRRLASAGFVEARRSGRALLYVPTATLDGVLPADATV